MSKEVTFTLACPPEAVTISGVQDTVEAFKKILDAAGASKWRIVDIGIHSIGLSAAPPVIDDDTEQSMDWLTGFVDALTSEDPANLTEYRAGIDGILGLASSNTAPIEFAVGSHHARLSPSDVKAISEMLQIASRRSYGRVRGSIFRMALEPNRRSLGIRDQASDSKVDVRFDSSLDEVVKTLHIGMRVDVKGIKRTHDCRVISMHAEDIEPVAEHHHRLVTASDILGIAPLDFTGGLGSVDYVAALRSGIARS